MAGGGGCGRVSLRIGHPSGTLQVRAEAVQRDEGSWCITKVSMYRSARVLMEGWVRIPAM